MNVNLIGNAAQLLGQLLDGGLEKQGIGSAAFFRPSINLFRDLRQRPGVDIETDEEFLRLTQRGSVNEASIARANIEDNAALERLDELLGFFRLQSSKGATADSS